MSTLRPATRADLPAINAIYNFYVESSPATFDTAPVSDAHRLAWFEQLSAKGFPVLVADSGGEVAGWCALFEWSARGAYATTREESIYVADELRGKGIGRALLAAILEEARGLGAHVVMAGVVACQEPSLALHRSLGFEQSAMHLHMG